MSKKTILVFNGGGLSPTLNPTLYGVIKEARRQGFNILGGMYGWACLLDGGKIIDLNNLNIESIKDRGGTFLRSSRTNPFKMDNGIGCLRSKIKEYQIDYIVAIGGDDTLGAARKLFEEENIPLVGIPKTIDNDLSGTYFSPGFPSAAYYLSNYVFEIKEDAAYALNRIYVIESLGMHAGWTAASSIYGQADIILPSEKEVCLDKMLYLLNKKYQENKNYAVVVVSQDAKFDQPIYARDEKYHDDQFDVKRQSYICLFLADRIQQELGVQTKAIYPGSYLASNVPIKIDKKYAIKLGRGSISLIKEKKFGRLVCIERPDWTKNKLKVNSIELSKVAGKNNYRCLPDEYFDYKNFKPTQKFLDYMEPLLGKFKSNPRDKYSKLIESIH